MPTTIHSSLFSDFYSLLEDWILYGFVDESNKIKYSYNTIFKNFLFAFSLFFLYSVLSDLMNQIFILNIHDCSESSYLRSLMLSIVLVYQKFVIRFYEIFLWAFAEVNFFHSSIECLHCYLMPKAIKYSIDSRKSFRFTNFFLPKHCFWTLFIYQSDLNQEYNVRWFIF